MGIISDIISEKWSVLSILYTGSSLDTLNHCSPPLLCHTVTPFKWASRQISSLKTSFQIDMWDYPWVRWTTATRHCYLSLCHSLSQGHHINLISSDVVSEIWNVLSIWCTGLSLDINPVCGTYPWVGQPALCHLSCTTHTSLCQTPLCHPHTSITTWTDIWMLDNSWVGQIIASTPHPPLPPFCLSQSLLHKFHTSITLSIASWLVSEENLWDIPWAWASGCIWSFISVALSSLFLKKGECLRCESKWLVIIPG